MVESQSIARKKKKKKKTKKKKKKKKKKKQKKKKKKKKKKEKNHKKKKNIMVVGGFFFFGVWSFTSLALGKREGELLVGKEKNHSVNDREDFCSSGCEKREGDLRGAAPPRC